MLLLLKMVVGVMIGITGGVEVGVILGGIQLGVIKRLPQHSADLPLVL